VRRGSGRWVLMGAVVVVAAAVAGWRVLGPVPGETGSGTAIGAGTLGSVGNGDRPGAGSVKKSAIVRLRVDSTPAGAAVLNAASGVRLGVTPLTVEQPASPEPLTVRLEKAGFAPSTRSVALDRDRTETVILSPVVDEPAKADGQAGPGTVKSATGKATGKATELSGGSSPGTEAGTKTVRPPKAKTPRPHHPARSDDEPAKL